jgi:undecaprenyl-diphosphatase
VKTRFAIPALLGLLLFVWLAIATSGTSAPAWDLAIRAAVHEQASERLTSVMKFVTRLGSGYLLWPCGTVIVLGLVSAKRRREAAFFVIAVVGANAWNEALKLVFHRARPEAYFGYAQPSNYSFPSGHSFVSFCFYLALAEMTMEAHWSMIRKIALWILAGLLVLAIGVSRVYLGVHYPSDVLGGYAAAVAWTFGVRTFLWGRPSPAEPQSR